MILKYRRNAPFWSALQIFAMVLTNFLLLGFMVIIASVLYPFALSITARILPTDILAMVQMTNFITYAAVIFALFPGFCIIRWYLFLRLDGMFIWKIQEIVNKPILPKRRSGTL